MKIDENSDKLFDNIIFGNLNNILSIRNEDIYLENFFNTETDKNYLSNIKLNDSDNRLASYTLYLINKFIQKELENKYPYIILYINYDTYIKHKLLYNVNSIDEYKNFLSEKIKENKEAVLDMSQSILDINDNIYCEYIYNTGKYNNLLEKYNSRLDIKICNKIIRIINVIKSIWKTK